MGARHGKTEAQNSRKRCIKKGLKGIHDRFQKFKISWCATQSWSDWGEVHRDGRVGTKIFYLSPITSGVWQISEKLIYLSQHIWKKCTDETPIRLQRSSNKDEPSPPRIWRRATCTDSFLPVSEMTFVVFFIQHIMVAVEWPLVELINSSESIPSELVKWAASQNRVTCWRRFLTELLRVTLWQDFLTCCSHIVYSW